MTRRTLLALPIIAPLAKLLGAKQKPVAALSAIRKCDIGGTEKVQYMFLTKSGRHIPPSSFDGMRIITDPTMPKNSVMIFNEHSWAAAINGNVISGEMPK